MNAAVLLLLLQAVAPVIDNDYVTVHRNAAPCASPRTGCGDRVVVALGPLTLGNDRLARGDVRVFGRSAAYTPPLDGEFVEVALKPGHPPVRTPGEIIVPDHYNVTHYEGDGFRVIEGRLEPGDTRERHTHNQRVIVYLNAARLRQFPDGAPERITQFIPDNIQFSEPATHALENIGDVAVRNIVIELRP